MLTSTPSRAIVRHAVTHEFWYLVHLVTYAAVLLALPHQFSQGGLFAAGTWARWYWLALAFGVLGAILVFRVMIPLARNARYRLRVTGVVQEAPVARVRGGGIRARTAAKSLDMDEVPRASRLSGPPPRSGSWSNTRGVF